MTSIGVRELRQRASEFLRRVEAGETIQVTDRGRPVALLTPIRHDGPLDLLRATGELEPTTEDSFPEPIDPAPGQVLPSVALAALRADER